MRPKTTMVKSIKINAGPYRTKTFVKAAEAAKFYAYWSNVNHYNGKSPAQIDSRYNRLYNRVLPIFKRMLKNERTN